LSFKLRWPRLRVYGFDLEAYELLPSPPPLPPLPLVVLKRFARRSVRRVGGGGSR